VTESKLVWQDTPFSFFAVQCEYPFTDDFHGTRPAFYLPTHLDGMQTLLAHSIETYRLNFAESGLVHSPVPPHIPNLVAASRLFLPDVSGHQ
jgi:hypothetical protein